MKQLFTFFFFRTSLLTLVCLLGFSVSSFEAHDFHYSFTVVRENARANTIEIEMKVFTDDFERLLESIYKPDLDLGSETEYEDTDELINTYLREHFSVIINDVPLQFSFIGKEVENDITWCYLEYIRPPGVNVIEVKNTVLFELFDDQINEASVSFSGWSKRIHLSKEQSSEKLFN